jgi:purine catabolism regulator
VASGSLNRWHQHDDVERTQLLDGEGEWLAMTVCGTAQPAAWGYTGTRCATGLTPQGTVLGLNLDGLRDRLELFAAVEFLEKETG